MRISRPVSFGSFVALVILGYLGTTTQATPIQSQPTPPPEFVPRLFRPHHKHTSTSPNGISYTAVAVATPTTTPQATLPVMHEDAIKVKGHNFDPWITSSATYNSFDHTLTYKWKHFSRSPVPAPNPIAISAGGDGVKPNGFGHGPVVPGRGGELGHDTITSSIPIAIHALESDTVTPSTPNVIHALESVPALDMSSVPAGMSPHGFGHGPVVPGKGSKLGDDTVTPSTTNVIRALESVPTLDMSSIPAGMVPHGIGHGPMVPGKGFNGSELDNSTASSSITNVIHALDSDSPAPTSSASKILAGLPHGPGPVVIGKGYNGSKLAYDTATSSSTTLLAGTSTTSTLPAHEAEKEVVVRRGRLPFCIVKNPGMVILPPCHKLPPIGPPMGQRHQIQPATPFRGPNNSPFMGTDVLMPTQG